MQTENHIFCLDSLKQLVPMTLIERISHLKRGCTSTTVKLLLKNKFIAHENKKCNGQRMQQILAFANTLFALHFSFKVDGYKLTYLGYDYLALQVSYMFNYGFCRDNYNLSKLGVHPQRSYQGGSWKNRMWKRVRYLQVR